MNKNEADNSYHRIESWGTEVGMVQHSALCAVEELEELLGLKRKEEAQNKKQAGSTRRTG